MNVLLEAKDLCKTYVNGKATPVPILKNINLHIEKGEFVSLMGPSGSGKSTLLYNLSGMDALTEGNVTFNGEELSLLSEKQLAKVRLNSMGFIFQHIHLLKNLSLLDNIIFSAYLAKKNNPRIINQRARALMQEMGIAELINKDITEASGGQLQRVAICRALINNPLIVFGDEPTGALDSKSTQDVMQIFDEINKSGTTILLATHDIKVASRSDRVVYIIDGKIVAEKRLGKFRDNTDPNEINCAKEFRASNSALEREKNLTAWLMDLGF